MRRDSRPPFSLLTKFIRLLEFCHVVANTTKMQQKALWDSRPYRFFPSQSSFDYTLELSVALRAIFRDSIGEMYRFWFFEFLSHFGRFHRPMPILYRY